MNSLEGYVYYLDQPNVDTDQIIPAKYLKEVSMEELGQYLFEGLDVNFNIQEDPAFQKASILVARENFGCGSSREHAVWALEGCGFKAVFAPSFARIFRQNMFNRGLLAIELKEDWIERLFRKKCDECEISLVKMQFSFARSTDDELNPFYRRFDLGKFEKDLVLCGGLVGYVMENY